MEVTMLTLRLNVKHSTFAQLMELEVWPSTASSVLMVHSSTRTTSSVTGGSTLIAPLPRISTLSMMKYAAGDEGLGAYEEGRSARRLGNRKNNRRGGRSQG